MKNKTLNQLVYLSLLSSAFALPVHAATITSNYSYVEGAVSATGNGTAVFNAADERAFLSDSFFEWYSDAYFYGGEYGDFPAGNDGITYIDASGGAGGYQNSVWGIDHYNIGTDRIYGSGSSYAVVSDPNSDLSSIDMTGRSVVDIIFTLASDHTYSLTGSLLSDALGSSIMHFNGDTAIQGENFSYNGYLAAGEYSFFIEAFSGINSVNSTSSSFDYDLQLTAVPIPGAIWLFGSGLLGLIGFTRRNKI